MPYLFNLAYLLALICFSPWLAYAALRKGKYRQGWAAKFWGQVPQRVGDRPCIWLHAVSVGEVNLLQPLLKQLLADRPDVECVISTTTRTGFDLARHKYAAYSVFYCPLDFSWAVKRALQRIHPDLLVLAELELWPNLIHAACRHGVEVAVINGRLSPHSYRGYRWIRPIIAHSLRQIKRIAAQNDEYANRFRELGARPEAVQVTGSIKFDGAQSERSNQATQSLAKLWNLGSQDRVFLAGSTQAPEETMAVNAWRSVSEQHPDWRLVLVPRHPDRFSEVAAMLDHSGIAWQKRSQLTETGVDPRAKILLIDAVGELGAWWGLAHVGFVGGSLSQRGGQNMIEPAAYGVAICFGPNTWNFRDVVTLLLDHHGAVVVHDQEELTQFLRHCSEQPDFGQRLGQAARRLALEQQGATARTSRLLLELLNPNAPLVAYP